MKVVNSLQKSRRAKASPQQGQKKEGGLQLPARTMGPMGGTRNLRRRGRRTFYLNNATCHSELARRKQRQTLSRNEKSVGQRQVAKGGSQLERKGTRGGGSSRYTLASTLQRIALRSEGGKKRPMMVKMLSGFPLKNPVRSEMEKTGKSDRPWK